MSPTLKITAALLLNVAVISVAVVADVYSEGPRQLSWEIPDSTWIMLESLALKNTLCVLLDR